MTWDDHDIFDGWGSYPDTLQNCPVFQGCYQAAKRFYLLFQQHTTAERACQETDLFGHRYMSRYFRHCNIPQCCLASSVTVMLHHSHNNSNSNVHNNIYNNNNQ